MRGAGQEMGGDKGEAGVRVNALGHQLTSTLLSHCRTDRNDCLAVTSYMTMTPSAFLKNCWVMQRYLSPRATCQGLQGIPAAPSVGGGGGRVGSGALLTSPVPPCPTAAGPRMSHQRASFSPDSRCLQGGGSLSLPDQRTMPRLPECPEAHEARGDKPP